MVTEKAWVTFCMSTYKRPVLLKQQLRSISHQTFKNFEVVVSDNDPDASARKVVASMNDIRFNYYHNSENLGMIKSFNKSIDKASADYIVMITDDDPVDENFLSEIHKLYEQDKSYGIYAGFLRNNRKSNEVEYISNETFAAEILNGNKTPNMLWSSCVIEKSVANQIGKIPDFGSPHLADHAFIAMAGSVKGAVVINKMYSTFTSHNSNFSKSNFDYYLKGCSGFYYTLTDYFKGNPNFALIKAAVDNHLKRWLLSNISTLKTHYSGTNSSEVVQDIEVSMEQILQLPFMRKHKIIYQLKSLVFPLRQKLKAAGLYPQRKR